MGKSEVPDWQKNCQANVEVRYVQYINKKQGEYEHRHIIQDNAFKHELFPLLHLI